jgi:hypothetical protein
VHTVGRVIIVPIVYMKKDRQVVAGLAFRWIHCWCVANQIKGVCWKNLDVFQLYHY